jgi:hypothetical protein
VSYLEQLLTVARDPRTPAGEARDANRHVLQEFVRGLGRDFVPHDEVMGWINTLRGDEASMQKAVVLQPAALNRLYPQPYREERDRRGHHQALLYVNELGVLGPAAGQRYAEKTTSGGFQFLKYLSANLDLFQAILFTRQRQVGAFCRPYREDDDNPLGYRWIRHDGEKLTAEDRTECRRLTQVLEHCGTELDPDRRRWDYRRRTFRGFIETLIADSLTADACPVELVGANNGGLAGWHNIDFATVRMAFEHGYEGDDKIVAVQLHPQDYYQPVIGFERGEIIYEVRNPRSDLFYGDYGQAELELFVRAATSYLNTFTFNAARLDRKSIPRGFLTLYGRYNPRALNEFKAMWNALVSGAAHAWNVPVLVSESRQEGGATWTPMDTAEQEMLMAKWIVFIGSLLCALYGLAPEEINIESFSAKQSPLSGKDTSEKLQSSRDRSFIPTMTWIEEWLNNNLLPRLSKKFGITWVGLFPDDEERRHERQKLTLTVDEIRQIDGADPHPDPDMGGAPVNASLLSIYSQQLQQQQMPGMDGGEGGIELPRSEAPLPYAREEEPRNGAARRQGAEDRAPKRDVGQNGGRGGFAKGRTDTPRLVVEIREIPPEEAW